MSGNNPLVKLIGSVQVRLATREDAERIMTVINSAFRSAEAFFIEADRIDLQSVVNFLDQGKFILAESGCNLLGCVYIEPRGERYYLGLLAVETSRHRSGVGSTLMEAAENYCRDLGLSFMDIKIVNHRHDLPAADELPGAGHTFQSASLEPGHVLSRCHPNRPRRERALWSQGNDEAPPSRRTGADFS